MVTRRRVTWTAALRMPAGLLVVLVFASLGMVGLSPLPVVALCQEPAFWHHLVDADGETGKWSSTSIDSAGQPGIAYYDSGAQALRYACWNGNGWDLSIVATGIGSWEAADRLYVSLAYGADDVPGIAFHARSDGMERLAYAYLDGPSWTVEVVDEGAEAGIGAYPSLAFDSESRPCISYHHPEKGLKYAQRNGPAPADWYVEVVDSTATGEYTSLAIDSSGRPGIAYYDRAAKSLRYAQWIEDTWDTVTVELGGNVGQYASLAYGPGDKPHIAYRDVNNTALKYAHYSGVWQTSWVDGMGWGEKVGEYAGLVVHTDASLPDESVTLMIVYYDRVDGRGKVARRIHGEPWSLYVLDPSSTTGKFASIAAGNKTAGISYYQEADGALKFAFLDQSLPWVSIDPVPDFASSAFTTTGTAWDDSSVDRISISISDRLNNSYWDGTGWVAAETWLEPSSHSPDWKSWSFDMTGVVFTDGTDYLVSARAEDVVGRLSAIATRSFTIDLTSPTVSITDHDYFIASPVTLTGTAADASPGLIDRVQLQIIDPITGLYWGGDDWQSTAVWLDAAGTVAWSYGTGVDGWSDGRYMVLARSLDMAGNMSAVVQAEFGYDATDPCLTLDEIPGYVRSMDSVSGTASDDAGLVRVEVQIQDEISMLYWNGDDWHESSAWLDATGAESWSLDSSQVSWTEGSTYVIRARVWDVSGRSTVEETSPFVWDTTPPWVSLDAIPGFVNHLSTISGSAGDAFPGLVDSIRLQLIRDGTSYWDGEEWQADPTWFSLPGTGSWSHGLPPLDTGVYTIKAMAIDKAGNTSVEDEKSFVFDDVPPLLTINPLADWINFVPVFGGSAGDTGPGQVDSVEVQLSRCDGSYWNGAVWQAEAVWLDAAGTGSWSYGPPELEDGEYRVAARAIDKAGNVSVESSRNFLIDRAAPVVSINPFENWLTSITGTADDPASGLESVTIAIMDGETGLFWDGSQWTEGQVWLDCENSHSWVFDSSGIPWMSERAYIITARALDRAGNGSAEVHGDLVHDDVIPTVSMQDPGHFVNNLPLLEGTASDGPDGELSRVEVQIRNDGDLIYWSGNAWQSTIVWVEASGIVDWTLVMPALENARYTVTARSVDRAGNLSVPESRTFIFDTVSPAVTLDHLPVFTSHARFAGVAQDDGSGLAAIQMSIRESATGRHWDGAAWQAGQVWLPADGLAAWNYEGALPDWLDGGAYEVRARAMDKAGNLSEEAKAVFTYDVSPPTVEIDKPPSLLNELPSITGQAADTAPGQVSRVEIRIKKVSGPRWWDGTDWNASAVWLVVSGELSWSYHMPHLADGKYTILARSIDAAGNISPDDLCTFRVHTVNPEVTVEAVPHFLAAPFVLQGTARDELGVQVVQVQVEQDAGSAFWNGAAWAADETWVDTSGTDTWSYALPELVDGVYTVRVRCVDLAGNYSEPSSQRFVFSTSPPENYGPLDPVKGSTDVSVRPVLRSATAFDQSSRLANGNEGVGVQYFFQIALDSQFTGHVQTSDWQDDAEWVPPTILLGEETYFWRVKARDNLGNEGPWSEISDFLTATMFTVTSTGDAEINGLAGDVKIIISAGSPHDGLKIGVVQVATAQPGEFPCGFVAASSQFRIDGFASSGEMLEMLEVSFRISLSYSEDDLAAAGGDASRLRLAYWDNSLGQWQELAARVDSRNQTLSATAAHLGEWRVLVAPPREGMAMWALLVIVLDGMLVTMVAGFVIWRQLGTVRNTQRIRGNAMRALSH